MSEVLERMRVRYQCSTCNRSWSSRKRAESHAETCIHDPAHRACATCMHDCPRTVGEYERPDGFECMIGVDKQGEMVIRNCETWEAR